MYVISFVIALLALFVMWKLKAMPFGMTALAAERDTTIKNSIFLGAFPVKASTKIYAGSAVCLGTDGYAVPAADTAGLIFIGRARETADNTSGSSGDIWINVDEGEFDWTCASFAQTQVGELVYFSDDQTVVVVGGSTNKVLAGVVTEFVSATKVFVRGANVMLHAARTGVNVAAVATADADGTYGSAEADLINELKAQVNALLTSLKNANVIKSA